MKLKLAGSLGHMQRERNPLGRVLHWKSNGGMGRMTCVT